MQLQSAGHQCGEEAEREHPYVLVVGTVRSYEAVAAGLQTQRKNRGRGGARQQTSLELEY